MKSIAGIGLCAYVMAATSAFATGPNTDYLFQVDEGMSSITVSLLGVGDTSPVEGTFILNLGDPTPGTPNTWDVLCQLESVSMFNTETLVFGSGAFQITINSGDLQLIDWDRYDDDETTLAGGPPISNGTINTEARLYGTGTFPTGQPIVIQEWIEAMDWNIQIADDNYLGVSDPASIGPEAIIQASGQREIMGMVLTVDVNIAGAVPEPTTASLLSVAGLGLLRRRRR